MSGPTRGTWLLAWSYARHHRAQTVILTLCVAVPIFLPIATRLLASRYERDLHARAADVPLVAGAAGERFDLTLGALYFRARGLAPIPAGAFEELRAEGRGTAIPLHLRATARGHTVVGTTPEYHELRRLRPVAGTLPLVLGDVTLGATVAQELELAPGDTLFSDQPEIYDISKPPAIELEVVGVLARTGRADDDVAFVDLKTAWMIEGRLHGHRDAGDVDAELVIARTGDAVTLSPALIEENAFLPERRSSFHAHGDPADLPVSAILYLPDDAKAGTLARSRLNTTAGLQMVAPGAVIDDLLGYVFRVRALLDILSLLLAASTLLLSALVLLLATRIRAAEMQTLHRIGAPRGVTLRLYAAETGLVLAASLVVAGLAVAATLLLLPDLLRFL